MRLAALALVLAAPLAAHAQVGAHPLTLDVTVSSGGAVTSSGEIPITDAVGLATLAVTAAPGLPLGLRLAATATYGPGNARGDGRTLGLGLGAEVPATGGRRGLYLALGAALLDFDNDTPNDCIADPECFSEIQPVGSYAGVAATVGVGARIPVLRRLTLEPAVSAFVWGEVLPAARLGVGYRIR